MYLYKKKIMPIYQVSKKIVTAEPTSPVVNNWIFCRDLNGNPFVAIMSFYEYKILRNKLKLGIGVGLKELSLIKPKNELDYLLINNLDHTQLFFFKEYIRNKRK